MPDGAAVVGVSARPILTAPERKGRPGKAFARKIMMIKNPSIPQPLIGQGDQGFALAAVPPAKRLKERLLSACGALRPVGAKWGTTTARPVAKCEIPLILVDAAKSWARQSILPRKR